MNHYEEIINELCKELSDADDLDEMRFREMKIACAVMLAHGYVFCTDSGRYMQDFWSEEGKQS